MLILNFISQGFFDIFKLLLIFVLVVAHVHFFTINLVYFLFINLGHFLEAILHRGYPRLHRKEGFGCSRRYAALDLILHLIKPISRNEGLQLSSVKNIFMLTFKYNLDLISHILELFLDSKVLMFDQSLFSNLDDESLMFRVICLVYYVVAIDDDFQFVRVQEPNHVAVLTLKLELAFDYGFDISEQDNSFACFPQVVFQAVLKLIHGREDVQLYAPFCIYQLNVLLELLKDKRIEDEGRLRLLLTTRRRYLQVRL